MSTESTLAVLLEDGDRDDIVAYANATPTTRDALQTLAREIATALLRAECSGRAVGVLSPNEPETIAAWFGVWGASAAFVPLNPRAPAAELARAVQATGVQAVIAWPDLADRVPHEEMISIAKGPFALLLGEVAVHGRDWVEPVAGLVDGGRLSGIRGMARSATASPAEPRELQGSLERRRAWRHQLERTQCHCSGRAGC